LELKFVVRDVKHLVVGILVFMEHVEPRYTKDIEVKANGEEPNEK